MALARYVTFALLFLAFNGCVHPMVMNTIPITEKQLTTAPHGHILTNIAVWSPDSRWIAYDVRSDPAGSLFDGGRIERVNIATGDVQVLYDAKNGARCGVVTCHPREDKVVFILGPEHPTPDWSYAADKRQGVIVDCGEGTKALRHEGTKGVATNLDARNVMPPFTPGALRGGTHVHVFCPADPRFVSFTYNDFVLCRFDRQTPEHETDLRNVGVTALHAPVTVPKSHPRNHGGAGFSVLLTRTTATPAPGSDQISKAYEDAWIGTDGYVRADGSRQQVALAFLGDVLTAGGQPITELFMVDVPDWPQTCQPSDGPLEGSATLRPRPPRDVVQRRLTFTADRKHPGLTGPRFWPRSSPDGSQIAFLMKDDAGIVQLHTIAPTGGPIRQLTRNPWPIASAFSWSPDGRSIAHGMDQSVFVTDVRSGQSTRLTARATQDSAPRPEACVFSPDGEWIAYIRPVQANGQTWNQVFIVNAPGSGR